MSASALQPPALFPTERQSVLRVLKYPRLLKTEVLAGLVVALALIPEAIAFPSSPGSIPGSGCLLRSRWQFPLRSLAVVPP